LTKLELLEAAERHRVLEEWNRTAQPVGEQSLPELFEAQVARSPDATAVVFGGQNLSYTELLLTVPPCQTAQIFTYPFVVS